MAKAERQPFDGPTELTNLRDVLSVMDRESAELTADRVEVMDDVANAKVDLGIKVAFDQLQNDAVIKRWGDNFESLGLPREYGEALGKVHARFGAEIQQRKIDQLLVPQEPRK